MTMQRMIVSQPGGPEAMQLEELETPAPGPGEVRVRVEAAGVNFIDVYLRSGQYPGPLPLTLGKEGAGTVEALGDGVDNLAIGARVAWSDVNGSYATHVIAPPDKLVAVPDAVSLRAAGAAMLQGMTAHYLTQSTYELSAGDTCLVHASAGGVGLLLCQLGRRVGARVIGTASTKDKAARARAAGASDVIDYTETDFETAVRTLTDDRGVDVVYDSVGRSTFEKSLHCLRPRGYLVLFGQSSGAVPPFDPQLLNRHGSLFLTRPSLFHYIGSRQELLSRAGDVLGWIASGELEINIGEALPLAEAAEAHRRLEGRQTTGKVLLIP